MWGLQVSAPFAGKTKTVKLYGGPMDGRLVTVPASAEVFHVGPPPRPLFTYRFAGRDGRQEMFAKAPKSRRERKYRAWHVGKFGVDPMIQHLKFRQTPVRKEKTT